MSSESMGSESMGSDGMRGARLYRRLLWLYPRPFRQEYGDDLVLLLKDQLRDEPAWRAYGRAAADLALTVPSRHLEAHMQRPPSALVPILSGSISIVFLLVLGAGASNPLLALLLALPGLVFAAVSISSWRRARPFTGSPATDHWWQFLAAGAALLGFIAVTTTITGELPSNTWFLAMAGILTAIGLMVTGVFLGLTRLVGRRLAH